MSTRTRIKVHFLEVGATVLVVTDCADCGVIFAITDDYEERRREDGKGFYCPNGHSLSYLETETDRLRKALDQEKLHHQWTRESRERAVKDAKVADYQRRAAKGQLTKAKKRAAAGLCPCCRRSFANVQAHVAGQHPDYVEQVANGGDAS